MFPKMAMTYGSVWEREHIDRVGFKGALILKKGGVLHLFGWGGKGKSREKWNELFGSRHCKSVGCKAREKNPRKGNSIP